MMPWLLTCPMALAIPFITVIANHGSAASLPLKTTAHASTPSRAPQADDENFPKRYGLLHANMRDSMSCEQHAKCYVGESGNPRGRDSCLMLWLSRADTGILATCDPSSRVRDRSFEAWQIAARDSVLASDLQKLRTCCTVWRPDTGPRGGTCLIIAQHPANTGI